MNEQISALSDGELDDESARRMLASLTRQPSSRQQLETCWLIGDALRREAALDIDLSARVMAALKDEPVVMAPAAWAARSETSEAKAVQPPTWMAIAAASCAVLVVAWAAISVRPEVQTSTSTMANASRAPTQQQLAAVPSLAASQTRNAQADERAYLIAHQAYAGGAPMASVAGYIRTVAEDQAIPAVR